MTDEKEKRAPRGSEQIEKRVGKNGELRFYARYTEHDGRRRHVKLGGTTLEEARKNLRAIMARVDAGKVGRDVQTPADKARARVTVRDLAERFCGYVEGEDGTPAETAWQTGHGGATRNPTKYRRQAWSVFRCHVLPTLGSRVAAELKPADVVRLRDGLQAAKKHARTVLRSVAHLSLLFSWAIENGHVEVANPCADVKKPTPKSRSEFYSTDEVARIMTKAAEHAPDLHPMIALAFYSGARKGEIAALQVGDCDLEGGRIILSRSWEYDARKSGDSVTVQVHPHLAAVLAPLLAGRKPGELVFPDRHGGMRDPYSKRNRNWGLDAVLKLAEVKKPLRPWHSFRHAHGTALAASGAGLAEIQEALGQSSLEMARRYTRVAAEKVRERIFALPTIGPVAPSKVVSMTDSRASHRCSSGTTRPADLHVHQGGTYRGIVTSTKSRT